MLSGDTSYELVGNAKRAGVNATCNVLLILSNQTTQMESIERGVGRFV